MTGRLTDVHRWHRLTELFDQAVELDAAARNRLLDETDRNDRDLAAELRRLLIADLGSSVLDDSGRMQARIERALNAIADAPDLTGTRIGHYRIERRLGGGGMGSVFLASRDEGGFEQQVALKLLKAGLADASARRHFLEERRLLARLSHPNIARLHDGGIGPGGEPWYAMEYVDGAPLTEWCDARKLAFAARIELFRKVCEAVEFAHRHLVIHRDLKPGNILVGADGQPKLLDFGIAKLLPAPDAQTRCDTRLMTPEYAAPEQLRNEPVGTATDVYALGAILFELLTGCRAFPDPLGSREQPPALRACATCGTQADARGASPGQLRKLLRGDLQRILRAALEPDPARRYRSAGALAEDLARYLRSAPISLRRDCGYRIGKFLRRHRFEAAAAAVSAIVLLAVSVFALTQVREARAQASRAGAVKDFMIGVFASADPARKPAARALLEAGERRLRQRVDDDPEVRDDLARALARGYAGIGAFDRARALTAQTLAENLKLHGRGGDQTADVRADHAEVLLSSGQQREAQRQAHIVLDMTQTDQTEAAMRAHLVNAAIDIQSLNAVQAETEARQSLLLAAVFPVRREQWQAEAWNALARAYLERGRIDEAQPALRNTYALYRPAPGGDPARANGARTERVFQLSRVGHP